MSLAIQIMNALRGCQLSGNELRHALHCTHEALYTELVRLEARGAIVVNYGYPTRGVCVRTWEIA